MRYDMGPDDMDDTFSREQISPESPELTEPQFELAKEKARLPFGWIIACGLVVAGSVFAVTEFTQDPNNSQHLNRPHVSSSNSSTAETTPISVASSTTGVLRKDTPSQPTSLPEATHVEPIPFERFDLGKDLSDRQIQGLLNATLRVESKTKACTGMVLEDQQSRTRLLITAYHCRDDQSDEHFLIGRRWQDGFNEVAVRADRWWGDPESDLLVGVIGQESPNLNYWTIPKIENRDPVPGTRFLLSSIPGGATMRYWTPLVFLGRDSSTSKGQWIFAMPPNTRPDVASKVAKPGSSGSLITDGQEHISVLWDSFGPTTDGGKPNSDWPTQKSYYQRLFNVDLSNVPGVVFASPYNQEIVDQYLAQSAASAGKS